MNYLRYVYRQSVSFGLIVMVAIGLSLGLWIQIASAAQITQRSLRLGSYDVNATTTHTFSFSYPITLDIGSIMFQYCESPLDMVPCVAPDGLDMSAASLTGQSGETGFTISSQTANQVILSRAPTSSGTGMNEYILSNAVNPVHRGTFYVRISALDGAHGTGTVVGYGALAQSVGRGVTVNTEVPPLLEFCVAQSIPGDCSSANGAIVELGELRPNTTAVGSSQLLAGTNAEFGLAIVAYGTTLTSGTRTIAALATPTPSAPGNAQFGINLRANTDPAVGANPAGAGVVNPTASFNIPNRFMFADIATIATTPSVTDIRKFTVSYIANVPPTQAPGAYSTTITYICTATF